MTNEPQLFKLPWRKWSAIANLPNTLVSIGSNEFQRVEAALKDKNRILILLGHDAQDDHTSAFTKLENDYRDRLEFVKKSPETLDELSNILADVSGWDILLFIGHGRSENNWQTGEIEIASGLRVAIGDLQAPFRQAIAQGLRLVILNCCDGLGLAHQLGMGQKLHLPHTIVMQDLFPVRATAQFLEYFLDEFTQYQSLDVALSKTQTKLEKELEVKYPCVSLLPYLCRNPSSKALTWLDLVGLPECPYGDLEKPRLEFAAIDWAGLERGIMAPADRFGVYMENGLVELVLQDIGIAPNSSQPISTIHLALLELVFRHIWLETAARKRIYLAIATYQDLGLVNILGEYAEQVYQRLEPQYGEARLQRIFTQLVDPQNTGNDSCRTATYEEIGEAKYSELLSHLGSSGLLLSINDGIEVVHETLVWGWQRLKDWVNHVDNRLFLLRLKQLRNEVAKWDSQERKPKYLLQGSPLDDVRSWLGRSEMTAVELDFIGLSLKRRDRQLKQTIFGVTIGLIVALGAAGVASWQWQLANQKTIEANQQRTEAELAGSSLLIENLVSSNKPFEALIEAIRTAKQIQQEKVEVSQDTRNKVTIALSKLVYTTKEINRLEVIEKDEVPISGVGGVTFSPDSKIIASYSSSKIRLWNLDGSLLKEISLKEPNKIISTNGKISFSPDGKLIALGVSIDNIDPSNPTKVFSGKSTYGVGIWDLEGKLVRILDGHSDFATAKFSPDGQTIVSSSYDKTTKIWSVDGKLLKTINSGNEGFSISPDGKLIATYDDENIYIINFQDGRTLKTLKAHQFVRNFAFHPHKNTLASVDYKGNIKIWDLKSGNNIRSLDCNKLGGFSNNILYSPDGKTIASIDRFNIQMWDQESNIDDCNLIPKFTGHSSLLNQISFSPDGKFLLSASSDNTIKLWEIDPTIKFTSIRNSGDIQEIAFSPNNQFLSLTEDKKITLVDRDGMTKKVLDKFQNQLIGSRFDSTGINLISIDKVGNIQYWDFEGKRIRSIEAKTKYLVPQGHIPAQDIVFHPDGSLFTSNGLSLIKWSLEGSYGKVLAVFNRPNLLYNIDLSPDGNTLVSTDAKNNILIYRAKQIAHKTLSGHNDKVFKIKFSPDGSLIASASADKSVRLWSIDGKEINTLKHNGAVLDVSFNPDGQKIYTSGQDGIKVWDKKGQLLSQFGGSRDESVGIGLSRDSDNKNGAVVIAVFDNSAALKAGVKVDDVIIEVDKQSTLNKTKKEILSLLGGNSEGSVLVKLLRSNSQVIEIEIKREKFKLPIPYTSISISPDGSILASGTDNTIKLWDNKGNLLKEISEHKGIITKLRFSRDGKFLASGGQGKAVKLWTLAGNAVATIDDNCFGVNDINFTLDSKSLVVACQNSVVRLWNLDGTLLKPLLGKFVSQEQAFGEVGAFIGRKIISSDIQSISFSPDNKEFIVANRNSLETWNVDGSRLKIWSKDIKIWVTSDNHVAVHISGEGVKPAITKAIYSPNGSLIATMGINNSVALWSREKGLIKEMLGHTAFVNDISFSQDSQLLVSVSHDQIIRLWNIKGDLVKILGGHNSPVYSVGFHPSDLFFASGDADGKIKLWSKDGKLLDTINIGSSVDKVRFSPDGTILAVAYRGQVTLIDLNLNTLINKGCDRIRNYLKNNPNVRESDRQLCQ